MQVRHPALNNRISGVMKNLTVLFFLICLVMAGSGSTFAAADTTAVPVGSRAFDLMTFVFPWTGTSNPAALSETNFGNISLAQAGYSISDDDIRMIQQPVQSSLYHAVTKGYMKLGRVSLFGSFGYSNAGYKGVNYNGTMMFDTYNPYLVGDSVSARQSREQFAMEGKLSYMLNDRISLAAGAEYLSAVGAKQKDPRNKNTISSLRVTPGITYDLGRTKVGISGSVYTTSNEMSYRVEGNWNQNVFVFLGLGYFRQEVNISSYSQWYTGKGYAGALQASREGNDMYMIAEVSYDHFTEEARTGSSLRLIDGITETDDISLSGMLRIEGGKAYHILALKASLKAVSGDEILQRSYKINKGTYTYDSLATVSWIENKQMITDLGGEVKYTRLVYDSEYNIDLEFGGALQAGYYSTEHFPVQSYGFYNTFNLGGSLFARKLLKAGRLLITPGLEAGYRMNLGSDISYTVQPLSVPAMVYHDYYVAKANIISASASVRIEMPFSQNKFVKSLFLIPRGRYAAAPGSEAGDLSGYLIDAVAGLTF